jgi:hypothetical protein
MLRIRITPEGVRMLQTAREWVSRVFAVWMILIAFMSAPSLVTPPTPLPSVLSVAATLSGPPHVQPSPMARRRVVRPSNATLCLAQVIFFEAGTESFEGMQAVAATVFNRVGLPGYSSSICGVVYQPYQYSWTLHRSNWMRRPPTQYVKLATLFLQERAELEEEYPVTHFHRTDIKPAWSKTLEYVVTIGQHKFYRG